MLTSRLGVQAWLLLCLLAHTVLAFALGLSVDEAHYALYALHPAWSYFDHPPLVGWLQMPAAWAATSLGAGWAEWALRLLPLLCWVATLLGLYRWSIWAALIFSLSPLHHLLGLALVPDTLLMPLTVLVMYLCIALHRALATSSQDQTHALDSAYRPTGVGVGPRLGLNHVSLLWLALGLALGLAGLAKYTAVLLALGVGLFLLLTQGLQILRHKGLWLAVGLASLCVLPVLWWNAQNDWISLRYQFGHAGGEQAWSAKRVLAFALVQVLAVGVLTVWGCWRWARLQRVLQAQSLGPNLSALPTLALCLGLPLLVLVVYLSGRGAALPHWTVPAWVALMPIAGLGFRGLWAGSQVALRVWLGLAAFQALVLGVLSVLLLSAGSPKLPQGGLERNPLADLYGWRAAVERAKALATEQGLPHLVVSNWTLASRLAWYAQPWSVRALDGKNQQFNIWFGRMQPGESALWVNWSQMPFEPPLRQITASQNPTTQATGGFETCTRLGEQSQHWPAMARWAQAWGGAESLPPLSTFTFYACQRWSNS
jgi:4-amino-4-deoxy-L-arabinose transferase-like glycosyltransferase